MTLRCGILTLKTSDSFFRSFRFLRQNEAFSATEQNQTYNHSFFFRRLTTIQWEDIPFWRFSFQIKTIDFWAIPFSSNLNTNFLLEPNSRKAEISYIIQCDVGASKNAGQAFSTPRLSSHFLLYNVSGFRFFSPSNQEFIILIGL